MRSNLLFSRANELVASLVRLTLFPKPRLDIERIPLIRPILGLLHDATFRLREQDMLWHQRNICRSTRTGFCRDSALQLNVHFEGSGLVNLATEVLFDWSDTSFDKRLRGSYIVRRRPCFDLQVLVHHRCETLMVSINAVKPSSAKYSHCIGTNTESAAAIALIVRRFGGKAEINKDEIIIIANGCECILKAYFTQTLPSAWFLPQ